MAHPPEQPVEKQARRHFPALIAIIVAVVLVIIAFLVFGGTDPEAITEEPTANTTETEAAAEEPTTTQ
ncbi:hypothetical protein [Paracoccus albus]|uniref:hypothetical protein n=1 Tax=Paracoccus albus TaxID=3017784 RepID=UPI0022F0C8AE|nr:hypothetical protein [Paracoccus albus]WBU59546.1 hypothetical protein PAF20_12340 [Paracoccus albus]